MLYPSQNVINHRLNHFFSSQQFSSRKCNHIPQIWQQDQISAKSSYGESGNDGEKGGETGMAKNMGIKGNTETRENVQNAPA